MASIYERKDRGKIYVSWMDADGKRRAKSFPSCERRAAKQFAARMEVERMASPVTRTDLETAIVNYLRDRYAACSFRTYERYKSTLTIFLGHVAPNGQRIPLADVTRADIQRWRDLRLENRKHWTVKADHKVVRAFYNWCIQQGYISNNTAAKVAYPHVKKRNPPYLPASRVNELLRQLQDEGLRTFYAICVLAARAGMRRSEILFQEWKNVDFENRDDVTIADYLKMIEYKTAVLVAAAMKMGAIIAETSEENANLIYEFGLNLGLAFQLQDDYLDAFGNPETFGKQVGGDIIENKKTYLYLKAVEFASADENEQLMHLYSIQPQDNSDKIISVKEIFNQTGASATTQKAIEDYTMKAFSTLEKLNIDSDKKAMLRAFGENLMGRKV